MRVWMAIVALCLLAACGGGPSAGPPPEVPSSAAQEMPNLEGRRIVMIIAQENFQDRELAVPKELFETGGASVVVASSSLDPATGMLGVTVTPDALLADLEAADYDAIVFVGGQGAEEYWDDSAAHALARAGVKQGKAVAAICLAPVTLANAGLLDGKKATVWKTESGRLRAQGADYTGAAVEADGNIITGNGPEAAEEFAQAIARALVE
jgi:protease I